MAQSYMPQVFGIYLPEAVSATLKSVEIQTKLSSNMTIVDTLKNNDCVDHYQTKIR